MNNQSILLIGNGPSVMDYEMGSVIDRHPLVCRFNAFKIDGYEKYVGKKCDIWVTCIYEPTVVLYQHMFRKIYFPLSQDKFVQMTKRIPNSECFPQEIYVKASMINGKYSYPSSGLLAVVFFLELQYEILLYGFDFFQGEKHHYCDAQPRGSNHSPTMELLAFNKLLEEKKVKLLLNESINKS